MLHGCPRDGQGEVPTPAMASEALEDAGDVSPTIPMQSRCVARRARVVRKVLASAVPMDAEALHEPTLSVAADPAEEER